MIIKKYPKSIIAVIVLIVAIAYSYRWTYTPYGRLDYRAAVSLHAFSFTVNYKPDPTVDFELPLPMSLIFLLDVVIPKEAVDKTQDVAIPGEGIKIPARIYWPKNFDSTKAAPIIAYFHGGGFMLGNVAQFDPLTRSLANATNAVVVSIDYRLAPAHPFPAAVDDCYVATKWVAENAASLGADPNKLVVAGDSAGGNLSAVVALKARDEGAPKIAAQILYYPVVDLTAATWESKTNFSDGYGLSTAAGKKFNEGYVAKADSANPYLSPLYATSHSNLPPALIITGGFDPLTSATKVYAEKLKNSGVTVTAINFPTIIHGFMSTAILPQRREALNDTQKFLEEVFQKNLAGN